MSERTPESETRERYAREMALTVGDLRPGPKYEGQEYEDDATVARHCEERSRDIRQALLPILARYRDEVLEEAKGMCDEVTCGARECALKASK